MPQTTDLPTRAREITTDTRDENLADALAPVVNDHVSVKVTAETDTKVIDANGMMKQHYHDYVLIHDTGENARLVAAMLADVLRAEVNEGEDGTLWVTTFAGT